MLRYHITDSIDVQGTNNLVFFNHIKSTSIIYIGFIYDKTLRFM